jgi:hypothetical protein
MKFTKVVVKKSFTECNRSKDEDRCMVRSLFGIVPEYEHMGKEKVSGVRSFANERLVRNFVSSRYDNSIISYISQLAQEFEKHFQKIHDVDCEEHCLVMKVDENGVESKVMDSPSDVQSYIDSQRRVLIVVAHFLPSVSRDMFYAVNGNSYNISYSNRFSFNGKNFLAKISLQQMRVFGRLEKEAMEDKIASVSDQLSKKFGRENVKAITQEHPFSGTQIVGFDISFDKLSHINVLKLVNLGMEYTVDIKASLQSMGMTKEQINEQ